MSRRRDDENRRPVRLSVRKFMEEKATEERQKQLRLERRRQMKLEEERRQQKKEQETQEAGPSIGRDDAVTPKSEPPRAKSTRGEPVVYEMTSCVSREIVNCAKERNYSWSLSKRVLPETDCTPLEHLLTTNPPRDFALIAEDGRSRRVNKDILQSQCSIFNVSSAWHIPRLELGVEFGVVMQIAAFVNVGWIWISNATVLKIMSAADYLGFDALLEVCVDFIGRQECPAKISIRAQKLFSHVKGVTAAFGQNLNKLPLDLWYPKQIPPLELQTVINSKQMKILLESDDLMVTDEDEALLLLISWSSQNRVSEKDVRELLDLIRYPLLSQLMADALRDEVFWQLPQHTFTGLDSERSCRKRTGFDFHVHMLWKEHRQNCRGPVSMGVSCVRWNKHSGLCTETPLFSSMERSREYEDSHTIEFAVIGDTVMRASYNRRRDGINVSNYDFDAGHSIERARLQLPQTRLVERPDFTIVKGTQDFALTYYESGVRVLDLDTQTWKNTADHTRARLIARLPCNPRELQFFEDCVVAITGRDIYICNADVSDFKAVVMPTQHGYYTDFIRLDNQLFVLEDVSSSRIGASNRPDLIHVVDLKQAILLSSTPIPLIPEKETHAKRFTIAAETTRKFIQIGDEVLVLIQNDSDIPLNIFRFCIERHTIELIVKLAGPGENHEDRNAVSSRAFAGVVPLRVFPCRKTPLIETRRGRNSASH